MSEEISDFSRSLTQLPVSHWHYENKQAPWNDSILVQFTHLQV